MQVFSKELLMAIKSVGIEKVECSSYTTWILLPNGDLYGCGDNTYGQQGNGSSGGNVTTFTKRASNVKDVFCTVDNTWYIDKNNRLYGCGNNNYGQQGGISSYYNSFSQRFSNIKSIYTSYNSSSGTTIKYGQTWYITTSGDLYGIGYNSAGQQGSGDTTNVTTFTKRASDVVKVMAEGTYSNCTTWYLTTSGDLYGCGDNTYGQQGNGSSGGNVTTFTKRASNVKDFYSAGTVIWYLTTSGDLYGCGAGSNGKQGSGSTTNVTTFTKRASNVSFIPMNHDNNTLTTWYVTTSGDLYGCGANFRGPQGSGNTTAVTTFTKRASNVVEASATSETTWYINSSGNLYGCGYNSSGQQGSGNTTNVTTFTKRASNVVKVIPTTSATFYIDNNNDIYGCGAGSDGQQGNGSTSNVTTFANKMRYLT